MDVAKTIAVCRGRAGLSLRELAERAGTSHSTIAAYEAGRKTPTTATFERLVRACGYAVDVEVSQRVRGDAELARGDELVAVLELASQFPARHAPRLEAPVFGR